MNKENIKNLLLKYHCTGGRYTTYPQMRDWTIGLTSHEWFENFEKSYDKDEGVDIYIHIPFCKSLCTFCGCNITITQNSALQEEYITSLIKEWENYKNIFPSLKVSSIYLGGGTPNYLSPLILDKLLKQFPNKTHDFYASLEADPRHFTSDHSKVLKEHGFNRISFGVQDFNTEVLKNLNRPQTFEQIEQARALAREYGFKEVSFDFIYGLPLQTPESTTNTFKRLATLSPDMIAHYPLAVAPWQAQSQHAMSIWQDHSASDKYDLYLNADQELMNQGYSNLGFGHYLGHDSLSSDAKSAENLKRSIMGFAPKKSKQLIGLGVSAISHSGTAYVQNEKVLAKYNYHVPIKKDQLLKGHFQTSSQIRQLDFLNTLICNSQADRTAKSKVA